MNDYSVNVIALAMAFGTTFAVVVKLITNLLSIQY